MKGFVWINRSAIGDTGPGLRGLGYRAASTPSTPGLGRTSSAGLGALGSETQAPSLDVAALKLS